MEQQIKIKATDFYGILQEANREEKDIIKVYHGLDHWCRCGCGGKYFYKGERGFTRAMNLMKKGLPKFSTSNVEAGPNYINIPDDGADNMCYCIYFN